jgi:predicted nucleic acid binding AN1-type Zn finger protein
MLIAGWRSNIRASSHPVALRSILRSVSHERAEQHANNRVEFSKQLRTHVFVKEEAAKQRNNTFGGVCTKLPISKLRTPSILRSVSHERAEQHANNRVEFSKQLRTHVFVKEEAAKQRNYTFGDVCTKLPVSRLHVSSILRSGSRESQTNNRVEFRKEFVTHVFDQREPAKQRSKTYRVRVCPNAPSKTNVLERQSTEMEPCNLAARFDEIQVEKEEHIEDLCVDDAADEVQFNDVGLEPTDPVILRGRKTSLQRETAALSCNLGAYWSRASPRRLRRSSRARKQPDRFIPSF